MGGAGCIAFRGWLKLLNSFCCWWEIDILLGAY